MNSYLSPQLKYMIFHIFTCILNHLLVYYELTTWPALNWLKIPFGRARHRYHRGYGFECRSGLCLYVSCSSEKSRGGTLYLLLAPALPWQGAQDFCLKKYLIYITVAVRCPRRVCLWLHRDKCSVKSMGGVYLVDTFSRVDFWTGLDSYSRLLMCLWKSSLTSFHDERNILVGLVFYKLTRANLEKKV